MINKSKLALVAALAAISFAAPASAQSFTKSDGTGNVLSFTYGPGGTKQASPGEAPQGAQFAVVQQAPPRQAAAAHELAQGRFAAAATHNLYNSAVVPFAGNADPSAEAPAVTGGGSLGYNEMLKNY
jgi:hypothetical protein